MEFIQQGTTAQWSKRWDEQRFPYDHLKPLQKQHNIYRFNKLDFETISCESVKITCFNTYGDSDIRIFEVRAY